MQKTVGLSLIMLFSSWCLFAELRQEVTRTRKDTKDVKQLQKHVASAITVLEAKEEDQDVDLSESGDDDAQRQYEEDEQDAE